MTGITRLGTPGVVPSSSSQGGGPVVVQRAKSNAEGLSMTAAGNKATITGMANGKSIDPSHEMGPFQAAVVIELPGDVVLIHPHTQRGNTAMDLAKFFKDEAAKQGITAVVSGDAQKADLTFVK